MKNSNILIVLLSLVLFGCVSSAEIRKFHAKKDNIRRNNAMLAQKLLTKKTIEQCKIEIVKKYKYPMLSPLRTNLAITKWFQRYPEIIYSLFDKRTYDDKNYLNNLVVIASRVDRKPHYEMQHGYVGCIYFLRNQKLEFFKTFGPRDLIKYR